MLASVTMAAVTPFMQCIVVVSRVVDCQVTQGNQSIRSELAWIELQTSWIGDPNVDPNIDLKASANGCSHSF